MSIGPKGRTVKCAKCAHNWVQMPEGATPEDVLQEPPEKTDSIPKGSSLPVIPQDITASGWLKSSVFALFIITIISAFILNYSTLLHKYPGLVSTYESLGIDNTQGLHLKKISITSLPGTNEGERPLYVLKGTMVNASEETRILPNLRINVMDEADNVLHSLMLKSSGETINPSEPFDFYNKLPNLSRRSYYVTIDIGNGLELSLR